MLRYTDTTLGNDALEYSNEVAVFANNTITIMSTNQPLKEVTVYDVLGKKLVHRKDVAQKELTLTELKRSNHVVIIKILLDNDTTVIKKVIF